jgi:hypothetical protein
MRSLFLLLAFAKTVRGPYRRHGSRWWGGLSRAASRAIPPDWRGR